MQQGRDAATPLYYPTPSTATSSSTPSTSAQRQPARPQDEDDYLSTHRDSDYQPIKPLAVISLFEHAYLARQHGQGEAPLGVWGKEQWVRDWFKLVDWAQVKGRAS
jgi:Fe-Mn family superoxide dismutase